MTTEPKNDDGHRQLLEMLIDNIPAMVYMKDVEGRLLACSKSLSDFLGVSREAALGKTSRELLPQKIADKQMVDDALVIANGNVLKTEELIVGADGIQIYETTKLPIRNGSGEVTGLCGISINVTDQKRLEKALEESKKLYDSLAEKIPIGIYLLRSKPDGAFAFEYVSPVLAKIFGVSAESLLNDIQISFKVIHPDDLESFVTLNQEVIPLRRPFDWKGRILIEGEIRWLHIESSPELQLNGDVLWHGIITDITEIKRADDALLNKSAELERFTYSVSHDLRSPLVTVKTFLGYLEQDMLAGRNERISEDIQFIRSAADKMELLLNELMELSRIGRHTNPTVAVSFSDLIGEVLSVLAGTLSQVRAEIIVADQDIILSGDRQRLVQIWQNLVENALKYSGEGNTPHVELGFERRDNDVEFYVRDRGIGIQSEYQDKIFGMFEKLDSKSVGAGLGLAMVKRIVELNGGRIWVESGGVGQGACFWFTLPEAVKG